MKCSVFIATSADGYIATEDGGVEWLDTAGRSEADIADNPDMGFAEYLSSVDCLIMGRKCMEKISSFELTADQWPYGERRIVVLSRTLREPSPNLPGKVEMYNGEIPHLIAEMEQQGFQHAYVDGGATITSFLNLQLIDEICLTRAPVLLGGGIPLFGKTDRQIRLENARASAFANDFVQVRYDLSYR